MILLGELNKSLTQLSSNLIKFNESEAITLQFNCNNEQKRNLTSNLMTCNLMNVKHSQIFNA